MLQKYMLKGVYLTAITVVIPPKQIFFHFFCRLFLASLLKDKVISILGPSVQMVLLSVLPRLRQNFNKNMKRKANCTVSILAENSYYCHTINLCNRPRKKHWQVARKANNRKMQKIREK